MMDISPSLCLKLYTLLMILLFSCQHVNSDVSCRDMNGNPVDWFIVYKMHAGYDFYYTDVNNPTWISGGSIASNSQSVAYTLQQVYKPSEELLHVMYNDEHPDGYKTDTYGHTKGVLASDQTSGFWLVHSVPHFPNPANASYEYPEQGTTYGQTFLCLTLSYQQMDTIGELYTYNHPSVYDYSIPSSFAGSVPNLVSVAKNHFHVKSAPWNITRPLTSKGGLPFQAFAKYTKFNADLYSDMLAPYYQSDLLVETWLLGTGKLPSDCTKKYKVYNVKDLQISGVSFRETQDHSKWAVTAEDGVVCIGDINRERAQFHRGGGTVCMKIPQVYKLFKNSVIDYSKCPA